MRGPVTCPGVTLHDVVRRPAASLVERTYREVLRPAIPPSELEPLPDVLRELDDGTRARMVVATDAAGDPVGTLMAVWYPASRALLVAYLAVRADRRDGGIGTRLLGALQDWVDEFRPLLVVGEVEDPRRTLPSSWGDPWARVRLYRRLGARVLDLPFVQPRLRGRSDPPPELLLMAVAPGGGVVRDGARAFLPAATVRAFVEEYHAESAGGTAPDERCRRMHDRLAGTSRIELVDLRPQGPGETTGPERPAPAPTRSRTGPVDDARGGTDLAMTARWTAAVRARESDRDDRLFDDPWAAGLAGPDALAWVAQRPAGTLAVMVLRTRYYDDVLQRAVHGDGVRQVVLLAAGLDTRAFRLGWPDGTVVFELDRPDVLDRKEAVLRSDGAVPRADRRACPGDLTDPGWPEVLLAAGLDRDAPVAVLAEGFLFYLPPDAVAGVLERVGTLAAPGSRLGFDIVNGAVLTHPATRGWVEMQAAAGAPWTGTLDDPVGTLDRLGWRAGLAQCGDPDVDHGRWQLPVIPASAPQLPHHWLVTADRVG